MLKINRRKVLAGIGYGAIGGIVCALVLSANAAFYQWSKTASSNSGADATINWAEGMSPSSVNDSARAMMARLAEYRDDMSGSLTTGGTSTAYTLTTNQGLPSTPTNGQTITFTAHATNGADPTLRIDGGTTYAIQGPSGTALPEGTLIANSPYQVKFRSSGGGAYVVFGLYGQPSTLPIGAAVPYTGSTAPNSNFILAAGQCISQSTYAAYFAVISTTYGSCSGANFRVPDLRGRVVAGKDDMGGTSANRLTNQSGGVNGDVLGDTGGNEVHTLTAAQLASHTHSITDVSHDHGLFAASGSGNTGSPTGNVLGSGASIYRNATAGEELHTSSIGTSTTGITATNANTGGGNPHNNVQPTIILNYLIRVL